MTDILTQPVLVVNRNWQAINVTDVQTAITDCAKGMRTIIDTRNMRPVTWDVWVTMEPGPEDRVIHTTHRAIRVPTVIAAINYAKMPKKRPKLSVRAIRERDGNKCQYTGRVLKPEEGSMDHVHSRARGGKDTWENLVWADKKVNQRKADKSPEEVGLTLLRKPFRPPEIPACKAIAPTYPDWVPFLA